MLAHAHCNIAYALYGKVSIGRSSPYSWTRIPIVSHDHANTVTLLHAQTHKPSGQGPDVGVKLAEVPGQVSLHTHVPRQWPTVCSRTFLSADESRTVRSLGQNFLGEIIGKSPIVERRVAGTLDGRKCDATRA